MKTIISTVPTGLRYMRGGYCLELGYPWLTRGAIIALEDILRPEFSVLELGCGGSTIFFANRCKTVKSFDFDEGWADKVRGKVNSNPGVEILCGDHKYVLDAVNNEPDGKYDVALVDIGNKTKPRLSLANVCVSKIRKGGYLVIDNYASRGINRFDCTGWHVCTFDDILNRRGITKPWSGTRILIKQW